MLESKMKIWYTIKATERFEVFFTPNIGVNNLICYYQLSALAVAKKLLSSVARCRTATVKVVLSLSGQKNKTGVRSASLVTQQFKKGESYINAMILSHSQRLCNLNICDFSGSGAITLERMRSAISISTAGKTGPLTLADRSPISPVSSLKARSAHRLAGRAASKMLPDYNWLPIKDGDPRAFALYRNHYSYKKYKDGRRKNTAYRNRHLICGPGEKTVLLTQNADALFVWRKFIDKSGQTGINCAVFRNESNVLSSLLILEAEQLAWQRWPGERLYTYVNASKVKSPNAGYCFKMAGWSKCGYTKSNKLVILEKLAGRAASGGGE